LVELSRKATAIARTERLAPPQQPEGPGEAREPLSSWILLAEDNHVNQLLVRVMLLKAGYRVDLAANGIEAVNALRKRAYSLVLMDIHMPEMDGVEATKRIRAFEDGNRNIPIIALTANAMKGDRERYLSAGMNDYVSKPIDPKLLLEAIARVTGAGRREMPVAVPEQQHPTGAA
jgi:CheY-like chemotaxis protein